MKMEGDIFKYVIYMKFFSRGFTLVELMVVIAIIWILTTALYPFLTGYLNRARDFAIKTAMIRLQIIKLMRDSMSQYQPVIALI